MRRALWLGTMLAALPRPADACSCVESPPASTALESAAAVFEGTVVQAVLSEDGRRYSVDFRVSRRWKGAPDETIAIETPSGGATCGFTFENGKTYLVYASEMQGSLVTTLCTRTRPIEMAGEDVALFGDPLATPAGDPVATRPAPPMLEPARPPSEDGGGCACGGRTHAEVESAGLVLFALRRRRRPHFVSL